MGSLGDRLRAAREAKGLSIEEVAEKMRLKKIQVADLEKDKYTSFPAAVYAKGALRNYADLLGVDLKNIQAQAPRVDPHYEAPEPVVVPPAPEVKSVPPPKLERREPVETVVERVEPPAKARVEPERTYREEDVESAESMPGVIELLMKKLGKRIAKLVLILLVLCLVFMGSGAVYHFLKHREGGLDMQKLEEGYYEEKVHVDVAQEALPLPSWRPQLGKSVSQ